MRDGPTYKTPVEFAVERGISPTKVRDWIARGELPAVNCAADANGKRPRWRIPPHAIETFDQRRTAKPPPPRPKKKRRRRGDVIQFF